MTGTDDSGSQRALRCALLWGTLGFGLMLRVSGIGGEALFGDELHTLLPSGEGLGEILTTFDGVGSHVVLPLLQNLFARALGPGLISFRMPALLPGILTLLLLYPIGRRLVGRAPALVATMLLAVSPMHVFYTRFARSYALVTLLGLLLIALLVRVLRSDQGGGEHDRPETVRRPMLLWSAVVVLAALIPYVHLSSAGFVGALGLATVLVRWRRTGEPRSMLLPVAVFGGAALLSLAAFAPILGQVVDYLTNAIPVDQRDHPSSWLGIPVLLAGGLLGAAFMLGALLIGWGSLFRKRSEVAVLTLAGLVGPLVTLVISQPHGMEFAYARYLLTALPGMLLVVGVGLCAVVGRALRTEVRVEWGASALGALLASALYLGGPLAARRPASPTFDNTYLAMRHLGAFDQPWPGRSALYDELQKPAGDLRIVEFPPLFTRSILLFRNHALTHGQSVRLGWTGDLPDGLVGGPYVDLNTVTATEADYILLHRQPRREVARYWRFVFEAVWPAAPSKVDAGFMERHRLSYVNGQPGTDPALMEQVAAGMRSRFGPPDFEDEMLYAWRLVP